MSWKKSKFSYVLWLVYAVSVCAGLLSVVAEFCASTGRSQRLGILVTGGALVVSGVIVLILHLILRNRKLPEWLNKKAGYTVEGVLVLALLVGGIVLRIMWLYNIADAGESMIYYETAKVANGQAIPQIVHGATYLYLNLLHIVLIVFGNKVLAAITMQIVLQLLAGLIFYWAVRGFTGRVASMVMLGFYMLTPVMIRDAATLSPNMLIFLAFSVVLCLVSNILRRHNTHPVWCIVVGLFAGLVCYLDLFGLMLLVFMLGVFAVERKDISFFWNERIVQFILFVIGSLVGFFAAIAVDAYSCGKPIIRILNAWGTIYYPEDFRLQALLEKMGSSAEFFILFGLLFVGIFSFMIDKKNETLWIWTVATILLVAAYCFGMLNQNTEAAIYIYIFCGALAGIGVRNLIPVATEVMEAPGGEVAGQEGKAVPVKPKDTRMQVEKDNKPKGQGEVTKAPVIGKPTLEFIDNPLPLPKKHQPKVMDYDYEVADDDDFDIK